MKYLVVVALLLLAASAYGQGSIAAGSDGTVIEGVLSQVSKLPPPAGNPYPDCYFTATVDVHHIVSGQSIPRRIVLVLPGFFSREYAPEARFKINDKIRAVVVPFGSMPEKVRQTQQADEVDDVDLEFFFPKKIASVAEFQNISSGVAFASKSQKPSAATNVKAVDLKAKTARLEAIQHDLKQIDKLLAKHEGDWDKWYDSLKNARATYDDQQKAKASRWIGDSFFSAGAIDRGMVYSPAFIKSVIEFKNYLALRNVDLILVRVPLKGEIVDDLFAPVQADEAINPYLLRMYKELLEADVEIITDIIPKAKTARLTHPAMYWYQDFDEWHPAEGMAWVVAEEFAKRITRYDSVKLSQIKDLILTKVNGSYNWPSGNPKFATTSSVPVSAVRYADGSPVSPKQGIDSPVLLVGSSFLSSPSDGQGGSIPNYLAYLAGVVPDVLKMNEGDLMMPRAIAREGEDFLRKRSVCLFPFTPSTPYRALTSLPIFAPERSSKKQIVSYSGEILQNSLKFPPSTPANVFHYTEDGILTIQPVKEDRGAEGSIIISVPNQVLNYPFFVVEVEFSSSDRSEVIARYSGQMDSVRRTERQPRMSETFAFRTSSSDHLDLDIIGSPWFRTSSAIKSISFFGVDKPNPYFPAQ